ncbi:NADH-ubiquinone oxidoreductase-F iron-sulfur binding region domain-containing protein [Streptomyces sp. JNUCC 64]
MRTVGLPLLTSGFDLAERLDLGTHLGVHGPLAPMGGERLAALTERIGLRGRGGAGFPFARKLRAVADAAVRRGTRPVVVVNGSEDEPACRKDTVLINRAPHLVLDGALLVAEALGARTLVVGVTRESTQRSMEGALAERGLSDRRGDPLRARVRRNPVRMVTGESSALIRSIDGGPPVPPGRRVRAAEAGVGGAPTLLSNAETFAQLAVAARMGAERYGAVGVREEPGTVLLTVSGAVARPLVLEAPSGVPLRYVLQLAGAPPLPQGVLTGGYHGKWLGASAAHGAVVSRAALEAAGGALGAGAVLPLAQDTCPLGEALLVARWLAGESAGQCGPCFRGLPAAAGGLEDVLTGGGAVALEALREVTRAVRGRGACRHPDGAATFVESSLAAFGDDLVAHVRGGGCGRPVRGTLPLRPFPDGDGGAVAGAGGTEPARQRLTVDWTRCEGHGLCADLVPELLRLGPDGYPSAAEVPVPEAARTRALRAVRRCPALALRLEADPHGSRPPLPAYPPLPPLPPRPPFPAGSPGPGSPALERADG